MENEISERIKQLTQELHQHNYNYYVLDQPCISDYDFDMLLEELASLEQQYPQYRDANSPTQRVGGQVTDRFTTVVHQHRMYSLANSYSREDLTDWADRVSKVLEHTNSTYTCEPKYDGVSISLVYEQGNLVKAVTRGDGLQGDDVTTNVRTIKTIPLVLQTQNPPKLLEVRGEIMMSLEIFSQLNQDRKKNNEAVYMNPRNTASGTLKLLDSKEVAKRKLDCIAYAAIIDAKDLKTHSQILNQLGEWGFTVSNEIKPVSSVNGIIDEIQQIENGRLEMPYEIDGVVVKVNELDYQEQLGHTAKSPRWAIAYKFKTERVETELLSVSYQVGRTGAITPIAELEPVLLGGTMVKRASLHNSDFIEKMELCQCDYVYIEKGGEIIPKVVGVNMDKRTNDSKPIAYIKHCPECHTALVRLEGEAQHYCPNQEGCLPQRSGRIRHFVSRKALDIEGLGSETIEMFCEKEIINSYADLYLLTKEKLLAQDRIAEKTADNIIEAIEKSKAVDYHRVLYGLGIRHVGETKAKRLCEYFDSIDKLMNATQEQLVEVDDVGEQIANSVVSFFADLQNRQIIEQLRTSGVSLKAVRKELVSNKLEGKVFVVSGVFANYSRDELKNTIKDHGGKVTTSISAKTNYLVSGDKTGASKMDKATKLSVEIVDENQFIQMLEN